MIRLILQYMVAFSLDFNAPVSHIRVVIVEEPLYSHARCDLEKDIMYFNKRHWERIPEVHQRELVYHELGHCALDMGHSEIDDVSIMRPRYYSTKLDGSNWKWLVLKMKERYHAK